MSFARKLGKIIGKNLKLILRSKGSALIVFFGPLFLILLVGTAFNTSSVYGIRVGVYADQYTSLGESLVQELAGKQFTVEKLASKETCIEELKAGTIHVCSIFPGDLSIEKESKIIFYVDPSRINLVYLVIEGISSQVETKSEEISLQLTKGILEVLTFTKEQLGHVKASPMEITHTSQTGLTSLQEADRLLGEQRFAFLENELEFDTIEEQAEQLRQQYNASVNGILGAVGRSKATLREKLAMLERSAVHRDSARRVLDALKNNFNKQEEEAAKLESAIQGIDQKVSGIASTSAGKLVSPISTSIEPVIAKKTHLNYLFPTLIMMIVMFMGVLLSALLIIREKTGISYFRNFISPTSEALFILGNYLTNILIIFLQLVIVLAVAFYFFKDALFAVLPGMLLVLFLFASLFIFLGMIIGYLFRSEETSILAAISISSIFLFFSNTILPLETLPVVIKKIASYNPFVIGESMLKKLMVFQSGIAGVQEMLLLVIGVVAGVFLLVLLTNALSKRATQA
ncbi:MAG: ABC transporter permease [Nanoarchaeota archaeon]